MQFVSFVHDLRIRSNKAAFSFTRNDNRRDYAQNLHTN